MGWRCVWLCAACRCKQGWLSQLRAACVCVVVHDMLHTARLLSLASSYVGMHVLPCCLGSMYKPCMLEQSRCTYNCDRL